MKPVLSILLSAALLIPISAHAASLTAGSTVQVSSNHSDFNLSVFPGKAGYNDFGLDGTPDSGKFGDGTVLDYRFFDSPGDALSTYADGGAGLISDSTAAPENISGAGEHWAVVWTTNDPGIDFAGGDVANFPAATITFARAQDITGTIDISGLTDGSLYFPHGTFIDQWNLDLVMSGPGQEDLVANQGVNANLPGTNMAWISDFGFEDASAYTEITYTYTNRDADGSRARFMGVILDGEANFGVEDSDADFLVDLWEDEHFGDNNGTVEPSDLSVTDGTGDADADGATDRQEHDNGSDPNVADTDGDGLDDGPEINTHSSDPTIVDSDGDGLGDGEEVETHGSDPTLVDSDGDNLNDDEEVAPGVDGFVTDPADTDSDDDGVSDDLDADPNDPSNDNDGDGLSNVDETNTHGTDPLVADTDGDEVSDGEEVVAGTDGFVTQPLNRDSDGDGFADGLEVVLGSNPTERVSVPSGVSSLAFGSRVRVSTNAADFNISVFPGKAGYVGDNESPVTSGTFGDGTVVDYRFFDSPDDSLNSYADSGAGLVGLATSPAENISGAGASWSDLWTTNDPGDNFDNPPPNFPTSVNTFARSANVTGTIDISRLQSGVVYFPHGTFINSWELTLVLSGPGQEDLVASDAQIGGGVDTNLAWISSFGFTNTGGYTTITYTYTNTDADGSRARFMGVVLDGVEDQSALRVTDITYSRTTAPDNIVVNLSFTSREGRSYSVFASGDFNLPIGGRVELDDSFPGAVGETTTTFPIDFNASGLPLADRQFFVVRENP